MNTLLFFIVLAGSAWSTVPDSTTQYVAFSSYNPGYDGLSEADKVTVTSSAGGLQRVGVWDDGLGNWNMSDGGSKATGKRKRPHKGGLFKNYEITIKFDPTKDTRITIQFHDVEGDDDDENPDDSEDDDEGDNTYQYEWDAGTQTWSQV